MTKQFLIAHRVRGEPAFDIAEKMPCPECTDGCAECEDTGYWWIVGTSGHRAHPYWYRPLKMGEWPPQVNDVPDIPMPAGLPDHYPTKSSPAPQRSIYDLMTRAGLRKPILRRI